MSGKASGDPEIASVGGPRSTGGLLDVELQNRLHRNDEQDDRSGQGDRADRNSPFREESGADNGREQHARRGQQARAQSNLPYERRRRTFCQRNERPNEINRTERYEENHEYLGTGERGPVQDAHLEVHRAILLGSSMILAMFAKNAASSPLVT